MAVYRRRGFEVAGARVLYRSPLWALPTRSSLAVEPWGADDLDAVARCYRRFALASNGLMDRSAEWWEHAVLVAPARGRSTATSSEGSTRSWVCRLHAGADPDP